MSTQTEKESKEPLKMKKKVGRPKKYTEQKKVTKVDLTKKEEDAIPEQSAGSVDAVEQTKDVEKVEERAPEPRLEEVTEEKVETKNEDANEEVTVINEVKEEAQELTKQAEQAIVKEETTGVQLPENIKKLVDFMQDTGGTVEDYVTLNKLFFVSYTLLALVLASIITDVLLSMGLFSNKTSLVLGGGMPVSLALIMLLFRTETMWVIITKTINSIPGNSLLANGIFFILLLSLGSFVFNQIALGYHVAKRSQKTFASMRLAVKADKDRGELMLNEIENQPK